ncbi:MAG TPA: peptidylprolyl isomerase [Gemmatimonadales bacterium]|nr:peptidylprolyl isomerase [Gemmatimonadales bacterium]
MTRSGTAAAVVVLLVGLAGSQATRLAAQDTTGVARPVPPAAVDSSPLTPRDTTARPALPAPDSTARPALPAPDPTARPALDSTLKPVPPPARASRPDTLADTSAEAASAEAMMPDTAVVVDRVVAVVGNRPVLSSQVDEEMFSRQSQGQQIPDDPDSIAAIRKQIVSSIVDEELLVQQAQRDTAIKVTDQEIADGVEQQVRKVRSNFQSEVDYKNELKKAGFETPEEYRRWLTDQQRRAAFQNRLIDKLRQDGKLKPVPPTDQEMRDYFQAQKGNLGSRPATISFRQIVIAPHPSPQAKARTLAQADSIVLELRRGADFATAAKRFSQDPGSKDQGGSLNWFRRGVMVPEFERVAFSLKPGVVSDPVESPFGYHIIQVERLQPGEVQARHILLIPDIDSIHVDSARALADSVRKLILRGASFDSLQRALHDPSAERQAENVPVDKMPEAYAKAIGQADSGAVAPVFELPGAGTRSQFVVLQVTGRRPPGDIRFEDVRDRIRDQLGQQLAIQRYIDRLRRATYVDIRS